MEIFYLAPAFAFLAFFEKPAPLGPSQSEQAFLSLIREFAEIFFTVFLLMVFEEFILKKIIVSPYPQEGMVPFLAAASYAVSRIFKKENFFFLTVLAFGFFVSNPRSGGAFLERVWLLLVLSLLFTLCRFALEGLRFRLLFSLAPQRLAGLPVLIFAFSIFLMALSGLKGIGK